MDIRFPNRYEWHWEIDEDIMNAQCIKMIFQPIVENAIQHGLDQSFDKGVLCIKGYRQNEKINILFEDNGGGMSQEKLKSLRHKLENKQHEQQGNLEKNHIGLCNINLRLKLTYGDDFGLNIIKSDKNGTTIKICIPSHDDESNE